MDSDDREFRPRGRASQPASVANTASDGAPDSEEINNMFSDSRLKMFISDAMENFFHLAYILTHQKDQFANTRFAAYMTLAAEAMFFTILCFSAQITWLRDMISFHESMDRVLLIADVVGVDVLHKTFLAVWIIFIAFVVVVVGCTIALANEVTPPGRLLRLTRVCVLFLIQVGHIPVLSILLSPMGCHSEGGAMVLGSSEEECFGPSNIKYFSLSLVGSIIYIAVAVLFSAIYFDITPKGGSHLSRSNSRIDLFVVSGHLVCVVIHSVVHSGKVLASFLFVVSTITFALWVYIPMYYKSHFNCLRASSRCFLFWTSLICLTYSGGESEGNIGGLIVYCILSPLFVVLGWKLTRRRLDQQKAVFLKEIAESEMQRKFGLPLLVELRCRHVFDDSSEATVPTCNHVKAIFSRAMKSAKKTSILTSQYCIFLLFFDQYSASGELQMLIFKLIGTKKQFLDEKYICICVRKIWQEKSSELGGKASFDMNDQLFYKRQLTIARYYHQECKKKLYFFWRGLLRSGTSEIQVENRAEEFEFFEQRAIASYDHLLKRFPNNKELLRCLGSFWMEIHGNASLANEYLSLADEIEEAESSKNSKSRFRSFQINEDGEENDDNPGNSQLDDNDDDKVDGMRHRKSIFKEAKTNTTATSKDRERLRYIRARLSKLQSKSATRESETIIIFNRILRILQIVLFGVPLAGFIFFYTYTNSLFAYTRTLSNTFEQLGHFHRISYVTRSQMLNEKNATCIMQTRFDTDMEALEFANKVNDLFLSQDLSTTQLRSYWASSSIPVKVYSGSQLEEVEVEMTFMSLLNNFASAAHMVLSKSPWGDTSKDPNYLFIKNNSATTIFNSFLESIDILLKSESRMSTRFQNIMIALVSFTMFVVFFTFFTWKPIYNKVRREVSALPLVRRMPKECILEMCRKYQLSSVEQADDADIRSELNVRLDVNQGSSFGKIVFLIFVMFSTIGCFVFWILSTKNAVIVLPEARMAALRLSYSHLTEYSTRELFLIPEITDYEINMTVRFRESMMLNHHGLVKLAIGNVKDVTWIFKTCVGVQDEGIQDFLVYYLDSSIYNTFYAQNTGEAERMDFAKNVLGYVPSDSAVVDCMTHVQKNMISEVDLSQTTTLSQGTIYFWVVWPFFFYFFAYQIPLSFKEQVRMTASRSTKLLKMVPPSLIEKSQKLKEYTIENGFLHMEDFEDFKGLAVNQVDEEVINEDELVSISRRNSFTEKTMNAPVITVKKDESAPTIMVQGQTADMLGQFVQSGVRFRSQNSIIKPETTDERPVSSASNRNSRRRSSKQDKRTPSNSSLHVDTVSSPPTESRHGNGEFLSQGNGPVVTQLGNGSTLIQSSSSHNSFTHHSSGRLSVHQVGQTPTAVIHGDPMVHSFGSESRPIITPPTTESLRRLNEGQVSLGHISITSFDHGSSGHENVHEAMPSTHKLIRVASGGGLEAGSGDINHIRPSQSIGSLDQIDERPRARQG